jgi:hypothetical protein
MSWRDLLQAVDETLSYPWTGGRTLRGSDDRRLTVEGRLPREYGWCTFKVSGRKARYTSPAEPQPLGFKVLGYLVGDRFISDGVRVDPDPQTIATFSEPVHILEDGLDRFVRISAGRIFDDGPLIYDALEMPLGPEEAVLEAFLDQKPSVSHIPGVVPALDAAFRLETYQRVEAERRRLEEERRLREEEEARQKEERRQELIKQLGDGRGRRALAAQDFGTAARAALAIGGAEYLDHRRSVNRGEMVVRFRLNHRRFECVCAERTLAIIDSGICLTAHYDDPNFTGGTKGDGWFTLESLPSVILEADRLGRLVVYRHVD